MNRRLHADRIDDLYQREEETPMAIEHERYEQDRQALMADPIIRDMAAGLAGVADEDLVHEDGGPRYEFMMAALQEYKRRGGTGATHIGGPAEALLRVRAQRRAEFDRAVEQVREEQRGVLDALGSETKPVSE